MWRRHRRLRGHHDSGNRPRPPNAGDSDRAPRLRCRSRRSRSRPRCRPTLADTDLTEGDGPAAVAGDTVLVHYVGVRSADGTEFDNSYDRGTPSPSPHSARRQVIDGWNQGLIGVKQGGRRQLDIPADLAYGDTPQGDIIQPGDALTFVIDVVAVHHQARSCRRTDRLDRRRPRTRRR